ncbi:hypothetical protein ACQ3I4_11640 [Zafaria sp. Z1313]|uniref:hypothetical protein n=1 Tax=unclassified Zafaria TaxID=2828765 RepID=UPI002E765CFB|nr:hypothetical protein [Zafaria sp. J156]MEE1622070.1 hypothetical protein [Zafaria sp. J156]
MPDTPPDASRPGLAIAPAQDTPATVGPQRELLRSVFRDVLDRVAPAYSVADWRPADAVRQKGRGSCSQRLAVVEDEARAAGIAVRTHGLEVGAAFWHRRFPRHHRVLPATVKLPWPEFLCDGAWLAAEDVFDPQPGRRFANTGCNTLFEALIDGIVTWRGDDPHGRDSLARHVVADHGRFPDRAAFAAACGTTFPRAVAPAVDAYLRIITRDSLRRENETP